MQAQANSIVGRLSFAGWCPIREQQNVYFKQGETIFEGNCKKNKVNFQSSCAPLRGYEGFFYCNVTGRGIQMDARSTIFVPTLPSVVSA